MMQLQQQLQKHQLRLQTVALSLWLAGLQRSISSTCHLSL
jgi:hypothetical protein